MAILAVRAVVKASEEASWPVSRLRGELRLALEACPVSRTTWRTAVVLVTGRGLRKLPDPRHATLERLRGEKGRAA